MTSRLKHIAVIQGHADPQRRYARLGRSHDWRPALQCVRAPTFVLHGAGDLQPESDTRAVAAAIPGASVEVIPASGHLLPDDAPEAFADAVRRFLGQVP